MKYYYCESWASWFVCFANNKKEAIRCAKDEFGNHIKEIHLATPDEIEKYCAEKGIDNKKEWINNKYTDVPKEENRQYQMRC